MKMDSYHMRRADLEITDAAEITGLLKAGKFATIALVDSGEPYLVTLSYAHDDSSNALYFHCAREGRKLEVIRKNNAACATIIRDDGYQHGKCTHHYASLVIRGKISECESRGEKMSALRVLIGQLEENPEDIERRALSAPEAIDGVTVLKFSIDSITGKLGR